MAMQISELTIDEIKIIFDSSDTNHIIKICDMIAHIIPFIRTIDKFSCLEDSLQKKIIFESGKYTISKLVTGRIKLFFILLIYKEIGPPLINSIYKVHHKINTVDNKLSSNWFFNLINRIKLFFGIKHQ